MTATDRTTIVALTAVEAGFVANAIEYAVMDAVRYGTPEPAVAWARDIAARIRDAVPPGLDEVLAPFTATTPPPFVPAPNGGRE